ncbi:hypothetical protein J8281_03530 [Aquimarina sp. U1-2]|nr:hypothetical protein [Aquimarina sp. U1-2]MBP2831249.1 hypothetical protein [Aquimarina sp. U1-2]
MDCDCYTVFISSILTNLGIPHEVRITKYNGKSHFQHIYPVVPDGETHIAIDCVADAFNYEVPYSGCKDVAINNPNPVGEVFGLSGVDTIDLLSGGTLDDLKQPDLPLRTSERFQTEAPLKPCLVNIVIKPVTQCIPKPKLAFSKAITTKKEEQSPKPQLRLAQVEAPELPTEVQPELFQETKQNPLSGWWIKTLIAIGVGYGTYKIVQRIN